MKYVNWLEWIWLLFVLVFVVLSEQMDFSLWSTRVVSLMLFVYLSVKVILSLKKCFRQESGNSGETKGDPEDGVNSNGDMRSQPSQEKTK